ncbi:MAG: hypothetical protein IPL67_01985 [Ignavibacteria bacterium]|nr:hypothetical protein [Ignavibacteria bacterium]
MHRVSSVSGYAGYIFGDGKGKDKRYLLRTHTSPGRGHVMENSKPADQSLSSDKVYRMTRSQRKKFLLCFIRLEGSMLTGGEFP